MEKKHNSCPVEKFFKAITVSSSPFRPIRRISNHHQNEDSIPSNPASNLSAASTSIPTVKTHHHTQKHPKPFLVVSEVSPIKFDYSDPQKNGKVASVGSSKNIEPISKFVQAKKIATKHKAKAAEEKRHKAPTRMESSNKTNANIEEDEFTKYIIRARNKIRTPSSVGDGKINAAAAASGEDRFSDYIDRSKKKMLRTMSSFVGGK